jgi:tetratricopeptide (TPR) repeat protein
LSRSFWASLCRKFNGRNKRALVLNPGGALVLVYYAGTLTYAGRPEETIPLFQKAIRLNPHGPIWYYAQLGEILFYTGRFEEAVSAYKKTIQHVSNHMFAHLFLAATYVKMGREKEARAEAAEHLRISPNFSLDWWAKTTPYKEQSIRDLVNALQKAGLK